MAMPCQSPAVAKILAQTILDMYSFLLTLMTALVWEKVSDFTIQFHIVYNQGICSPSLGLLPPSPYHQVYSKDRSPVGTAKHHLPLSELSWPCPNPCLRMQLAEGLRRPLGAVCPATPSPPLPVWSLGQSLQEVSSLLLLPSQALINGPSPCSSDGES